MLGLGDNGMKRIVIFCFGLAILLLGCSPSGEITVWETVADVLEAPASAAQPAYHISVAPPMEAPLAEAFSSDACQVYGQEDGRYTLTVQIMQADSMDELLKELTGFDRANLAVVTTQEFDMPRYDLTWICAGETGLLSCRAAILDDGTHYYVVTSQVPAENGELCRQQINQFFDSFGLYTSEGV